MFFWGGGAVGGCGKCPFGRLTRLQVFVQPRGKGNTNMTEWAYAARGHDETLNSPARGVGTLSKREQDHNFRSGAPVHKAVF